MLDGTDDRIPVSLCSSRHLADMQRDGAVDPFVLQVCANLGSRAPTRLSVLPNFRTGAAPSSHRGFVLEMRDDTPAQALLPYLDALGGRVSTVPLPSSVLAKLSLQEWMQRAADANLASTLHDDDTRDNGEPYLLDKGDAVPWALALGSRSHFSGVFARVDARSRIGNGALVTHTGADEQVCQLRAFIESQSAFTVGDLLDSDQYTRLQHYADRNNRAVAARVAELLNLPVSVEDDLDEAPTTTTGNGDGAANHSYHHPRPLVTGHSMARYGVLARDDRLVRLFNRAIALEQSDGDQLSLLVDPLGGVVRYRFANTVSPGDDRVRLLKNACMNALPLGAVTHHHRRQQQPVLLEKQQQEEINRRLWWPGKQSGGTTDSGLGVYARVACAGEAEFAENDATMNSLGLKAPHLESDAMVPLAVLVSGN